MKLLLSILFSGVCCLQAQPLLTLKDALAIASKENYDLQAVKNDQILAKSHEYYGNAGEQPIYTFVAGDNMQLIGVNQKLSNGNEIIRTGVPSNAFSTQLGVAYPVFNKSRTRAIKNRISEQSNIAGYRTRAESQNIAAQIIQKYYEIIRQQKLIRFLETSLEVSKQRLELVNNRQALGMAAGTEVYLAELDLNSRRQELVNQELILKQSKSALNILLAKPAESDFSVTDSIDVDPGLRFEALLESAKQNPEIMMSVGQSKVLDWLEKETHAQRLPNARINGGLAGSISNTTAGFLLQNASYGPFIGASVNVPLFNRDIFDRQEQLVSIQRRSSDIRTKSIQNSIEGNLYRLYTAYQTYLGNMPVESKNTETAKKYLELVLERYRLNQSNAIELREAQLSYEQSIYRLISVQYSAKITETELMRLASMIPIEN